MTPPPPPSRIVVLTGAGVSAESGVPTFRASDGLWENHRIEDVATPEGFARNPDLVHRFYNERRKRLAAVAPNDAHYALAEFERDFLADGEKEFLLVTQNIDDLHERAGSRNLVHMHGEILKMQCINCGGVFASADKIETNDSCVGCGERGGLRPHIVWFGEMPLELNRIAGAIERCDLFVSVGTSGNVYPAAGFVQMAKMTGAQCAELNLEPSVNGALFDFSRRGPATKIVPQFFSELT